MDVVSHQGDPMFLELWILRNDVAIGSAQLASLPVPTS
jgi:hypothetical protein